MFAEYEAPLFFGFQNKALERGLDAWRIVLGVMPGRCILDPFTCLCGMVNHKGKSATVQHTDKCESEGVPATGIGAAPLSQYLLGCTLQLVRLHGGRSQGEEETYWVTSGTYKVTPPRMLHNAPPSVGSEDIAPRCCRCVPDPSVFV